MQLDRAGSFHLTYCTNIHPGNGWSEVEANLRRFAPPLKRRLSPDAPFGLGLRLSARDARELLEAHRLEDFRSFLADEGLYVALINGFPHGSFHRTAVKADVYAPDWREDERVRYTLDLVTILGTLLPAGMDGGVSTAPLSYKPWVAAAGQERWRAFVPNVVRVAESLVRLRREQGKLIHLDIEPEPDCLIEHSDEFIAFFEGSLLPDGGPMLAAALGCSIEDARAHLRDHVRICFDCCHFAVEFEDPGAALARLRRAGIHVGRVQLSSALTVEFPDDQAAAAALAEQLHRFADSTYLHQVIVRQPGQALRHFPDLDDALRSGARTAGAEWRIHFHVPLFTAAYDGLGSTQDYVRTVLDIAGRTRFAHHFEIETYTWDVLPAGLKIDLLDSIGREYEWVIEHFRVTP
ncbi:MAG: metabolite traffic protein EboE [Acidobacteriota bacterium]|nr:metabolite traffic protein EboE [Acidobacteriota bacterium]